MQWPHSNSNNPLKEIDNNMTKPNEVGRILKEDGLNARELSPGDCFEMINVVLRLGHLAAGHSLLDHAKAMFTEEINRKEIYGQKVLQVASKSNEISLAERLITMVDVHEYGEPHECPLLIAIALRSMGFCPSVLFGHYYNHYDDPIWDEARDFVHHLLDDEMAEKDKEVWRVLAPHLKPQKVISSRLVFDIICEKRVGSKMLLTLEKIGVVFGPLISSCSTEVIMCMRKALTDDDLGVVQYLIGRGFDVDVPVEGTATRALPYYISVSWILTSSNPNVYYTVFIQILLELIRSGANPCKKDEGYSSAIYLCAERALLKKSRRCSMALMLFTRLGYMLPEISRNLVRYMASPEVSNLASEINTVSSLQSLCSKAIRCEKRGNVVRFIQSLHYPQKLKDFILLKDFAFNEIIAKNLPSGLKARRQNTQ